VTRRTTDGSSPQLRAISAAIFIVALFVRLLPLGFYVTPDEPIWVHRSVQFLRALESGDVAAIPQTGHPGVTTMALGALGVWLTRLANPHAASIHLGWIDRIVWLAPENGPAFPHLAFFLPAGRVLVALVTAAATALAYVLGRRRFGERGARLAALFLALDPFLGGHAGLLHTDALQATFIFLAVLLVLPVRPAEAASRRGARGDRWILPWAGAALCLALAGLTKTLGLLAAPGLALAVLLWHPGSWQQRAGRVAALTGLTVILLLALYPPFWIGPRVAIRSLIDAVSYHEGIGLRSVFFAGETRADPGPAFYPAVLVFRMTPPVLAGLLGYVAGRRRHAARSPVRAGWFLLPAAVYLVALTAATKKFDRYVLSVVPLLTVVAALSWRGSRRWWRWVLLATLGLPWALVAVAPLHYATPLLGGSWVAQRIVPLGWGEASGFAAHKLNRRLPSAETATVLTRDVPGTASIFAGEVWPWREEAIGCTEALIAWDERAPAPYTQSTDVWVAGRRLATVSTSTASYPSEIVLVASGPLPGVPPAAVAPIANTAQLQSWLADMLEPGVSFNWIHAPQCYPLTERQLQDLLTQAAVTCKPANAQGALEVETCQWQPSPQAASPYLARFQGALDLVSATWAELAQAPGTLTVRLRWQPVAPLGDLDVYLALHSAEEPQELVWAEGGRLLLSDWGWSVTDWGTGELVDAEAYIPLPLHLAPGRYRLILSLAEAGRWLGLSLPDGTFGGTQLELGSLEVTAPPYSAGELDLGRALDIPLAGLRIVGVTLPAEPLLAGERVPFSLGVQREPGTPPQALAWALVCDGVVRDAGELSWPSSEPATWPSGHRYVLRYAPRTDPGLVEGPCQLAVTASPEESVDPSEYGVLGDIQIAQRPRRFGLPSEPERPLEVWAGEFGGLAGADGPAQSLRAGDAATVTLYWRAAAAADRNYAAFVHLVGPDGQVWAQSDHEPAGGQAPTMTWVEGEFVVDLHTLQLAADTPPGRYEVYVGLYAPDRGMRVPLYTRTSATAGLAPLPEARVRIATVDVTP